MPAGWSDTRNSIQRRTYDCACSLLVVDDMKERAHLATSEVIFQAQGNGRDRSRMGSDQSLLQSLPPRGSILSTGEIDHTALQRAAGSWRSRSGRVTSGWISWSHSRGPVTTACMPGDVRLHSMAGPAVR